MPGSDQTSERCIILLYNTFYAVHLSLIWLEHSIKEYVGLWRYVWKVLWGGGGGRRRRGECCKQGAGGVFLTPTLWHAALTLRPPDIRHSLPVSHRFRHQHHTLYLHHLYAPFTRTIITFMITVSLLGAVVIGNSAGFPNGRLRVSPIWIKPMTYEIDSFVAT